MKMKKSGESSKKNSKQDIKEKEGMFTIISMQINNAGHVENMGT
jgi:hypothetical protein